MATVTDKAIEVVEKFLRQLKAADIKIERAILFGSYVRGQAGEWSDIDIAVVSPDFSGIRFNDCKMLLPFVLKSDIRIDIHPFRPEDFTEDNLIVKEIMKDGLEIKVHHS
jgi:predicted nucleotidyltransferase